MSKTVAVQPKKTEAKKVLAIKVAIGAFITNDKGQILMGLRKNISGAGEWQVPGGHLEYNERLVDGARREIQEETGLIVGAMHIVSVIDELPGMLSRPESHYVTIYFTAQHLGGEPRVMEPHKCAEWRWFSLDQLPEQMSPGMRHAIENYRDKRVYQA